MANYWIISWPPTVSALINASTQRKGSDGKTYTDKTIFGDGASAGGYRSKLDAGIVTDAEYGFKNGFCIAVCYRRGFIPIIENTNAQQQWRIYNQHIALSVGLNLR